MPAYGVVTTPSPPFWFHRPLRHFVPFYRAAAINPKDGGERGEVGGGVEKRDPKGRQEKRYEIFLLKMFLDL
jgi:hypothetical protein